jgi:GPH family glycoside/pentoside/hexuronide:cation symporter
MKTSYKLYYGIGPLGSALCLRLLEFSTLYYYVQSAIGLGGVLAGIGNALGKVAIMGSQFGAGALSDRLKNKRFGRRKPFVLSGMPLLAISMILLYVPTYFVAAGDQIPLFLYLSLWVCMAEFWFGWIITPYASWMPELTEPRERVQLSAIWNTTNMIGNAGGVLVGFVFPALMPNWSAIFSIMVVIGLVQATFYIPAMIKIVEPPEKRINIPSIRRELRVVTANSNYMKWLLCQGLLSVGFISIQSLVLGFVQNVLLFSSITDYAMFGGIFLLVIIVSFLFWMKMYSRIGKRKSLAISMIFLSAVLPFSMVIGPDIPLSLFMQGFIYVALVSLGMAGYVLIPTVIMADIAHEDELRSGEARAGIYNGFNSIPLNAFQVFGFLISGILVDQTILPNYAGYHLFGLVLPIFLVLGAVALHWVQVDFDFKKLDKEYKAKREEIKQ